MEDNNKNNNSEKLAKLLGTKPRYTMWINIGDLDNNYIKVSDERKYKLIADNRCYFDDYNKYPEITLEYPDFYKPENFVKLLELNLTEANDNANSFLNLWTVINEYNLEQGECVQSVNNFIDDLILLLTDGFYGYDRYLELIKHQAQITKWEY